MSLSAAPVHPRSHRPRGLASVLALAVLGASAGAVGTNALPASATVPISTVELPGVVRALDVATVPGDAIWIARGGTVVRFVPGSAPQTFDLPDGSNARHLAVAPDGTLWFGGLAGALGTIRSDGAVTTRSLADPSATVNSLAVGNDGALWVLAAGGSFVNHLERGAPGGPMTAVPLPDNTRYDLVAAGGSGAVVAVGNDDASIAADGTTTPLSGIPGGITTDIATIDNRTWVTTTSGVASIDALDTVAAYPTASNLVPGGVPATITAGPGATAWYAAGNSTDSAIHLGRIGASGPEAATTLVASDGPTAAVSAEHLVADPSATRLWAVTFDGTIHLVPVDVSRQLTTLTVDDPGGDLAFGVPTQVTARFTAFPGGTVPTSGTVTFSDHGAALVTVPMQAGGVVTTTIDPPAGSLILSASYAGNGTHAPALSDAASFRPVADAATTTTLTAPAGALRPWTSPTFKVKVTSPVAGQPTGTVKVGSLEIPVSGGTDTSFAFGLPAGETTLHATFVPDPGFAASTASYGPFVARWDTDEEDYVMAAYQRLFGRTPDPTGRTYWAKKIHDGLSRDRFALTHVATSEYRRTLAKRVGLVAPGATVAQAKPMVDAMAKRTVRELLVDTWADGKKVTTCKDTIPPEFAAPGSFMCWVKVIFTTFTGSATAEDYAWANSYGNTLDGRRKIAKVLVYSDTAVRPIVAAAYSAYLNRAPDPSGWAYWTKKIQAGLREEGVEARLLGSDEFYRRTLLPPA